MAKWVNAPQRKHNAVYMFCKWCRGRRSFATVVKERENAAVRDNNSLFIRVSCSLVRPQHGPSSIFFKFPYVKTSVRVSSRLSEARSNSRLRKALSAAAASPFLLLSPSSSLFFVFLTFVLIVFTYSYFLSCHIPFPFLANLRRLIEQPTRKKTRTADDIAPGIALGARNQLFSHTPSLARALAPSCPLSRILPASEPSRPLPSPASAVGRPPGPVWGLPCHTPN